MAYHNDNKVNRSWLKDDPDVEINRQRYQITIMNTLKKFRKGEQNRWKMERN